MNFNAILLDNVIAMQCMERSDGDNNGFWHISAERGGFKLHFKPMTAKQLASCSCSFLQAVCERIDLFFAFEFY